MKPERRFTHGPRCARAELGAALFEAGLLKEAEAELTAAISLNPTDTDSVVRLARVYLARKDIPAAGRTLEASVARGNDPAPVYALLADVYEQSGHVENAIPAMRLAIQRDPQSEKYRFAYAVLLTNSNAPGAAVIRLEEALQSFPSSSRLWFALGFANFKLDKNEEAERALRKAIDLDPKFAPAFAYLGLIRAKTGAYGEAISLYESALRADPKLAVVHHLIADAMLKQMNADARRYRDASEAVSGDGSDIHAGASLTRQALHALSTMGRGCRRTRAGYQARPERARSLLPTWPRLRSTQTNCRAQSAMATFKRLSDAQKKREDEELREVVKRLSNVRF